MSEGKKYLFEVAWEVVNKVGGIHTVVRTKAQETEAEFTDSYFMVGPYNQNDATTEVEDGECGIAEIDESIQSMKQNGIKVYTGRWLIPGNPHVILFDILSGYPHIDGWRQELYETCGISLPAFDKELSDSLVFGGLVGWFLREIRQKFRHSVLVIAHFHEWLSSVGLILSRKRNLDISYLFTTHATLMGRHLAAGGCDLYNKLKSYNCDLESGKRGFYAQYCIERAACHSAHVFTTVSNITADEADAFLGRYPDIITPNGLCVNKYTALHEFQHLHIVAKENINEFIRGHFFGSYYIDLDKVVYLFNAGRYEFSNKGVDVLLEAASRLNFILKAKNVDITVILFLIFQGKTNNFNVESLKRQAIVRQLKQTIQNIQKGLGERILNSVIEGKLPKFEDLLQTDNMIELKKFIQSSKGGGSYPPIVTHNMIDDAGDPILCALRRLKLINAPEDKVKVIFHPAFLSSTNPLFPIAYDTFVRGCHLGVFPSYYEPWGYTPAECTILGIPSLSTNLSGFGQFIEERIENPTEYGLYIMDRRHRNLNDSINQMTHHLYHFVKQSRRQRIMQRNRCERLCSILDWKELNTFYIKARMLAVERTHPDKLGLFKQLNNQVISSKKIKRSFSMGKALSDLSSDDEIPHLWGDTDQDIKNPFDKFD